MISLFAFLGIFSLIAACAGIYWLVAYSIMRDDIDGQYYDSLEEEHSESTIL